jgi:hypothetical protein
MRIKRSDSVLSGSNFAHSGIFLVIAMGATLGTVAMTSIGLVGRDILSAMGLFR